MPYGWRLLYEEEIRSVEGRVVTPVTGSQVQAGAAPAASQPPLMKSFWYCCLPVVTSLRGAK